MSSELNSERIARIYGNCGIEVLSLSWNRRISILYSQENDCKVARTLAIVDLDLPIDERLKQAHEEICQGNSIGLTLRKHGWNIEKVSLHIGNISLPPFLQHLMNDQSPTAAVHVYQLRPYQKECRLLYCTIIEVYHPQYMDVETLHSLANN